MVINLQQIRQEIELIGTSAWLGPALHWYYVKKIILPRISHSVNRQITDMVFVKTSRLESQIKNQIINKWIATFQMRTRHLKHDQSIEPSFDSSEKFTVIALVAEPFPIISRNRR